MSNKIIDEVVRRETNTFNDDGRLSITYHCYDYKKSIVCNSFLNISHLLYMLDLNDFYNTHIIQIIDKPEFK